MTVEDKLAITELLYRYAELIDAGDFDGVGSCWPAPRSAERGRRECRGPHRSPSCFAATTRRYPDHGNTPRTRHLVLNPIVELSSGRNSDLALDVLRRAEHRGRAAAADRGRPLFRQLHLRR